MKEYIAELYNISEWILQQGDFPPTGSRPNTIYENPQTNLRYYFKQSKPGMPKSEFWSEIIASKFGQMLGYNVLDYNIGLHKDILGVLSESMIDKEECCTFLYHGIDILKDYLPNFQIQSGKNPTYSFQDIVYICNASDNKEFITNFAEMILFDAVIGNTDRHTENWAFINNEGIYRFSPIYDSGSCLSSKIAEEDLEKYLANENMQEIRNYHYNTVRSEMQWSKKKVSLFELVKKVNIEVPHILKYHAHKLFDIANKRNIENLVLNIDNNLKLSGLDSLLSQNRKQFIIKTLNQRTTFLKEILC